jgi:hypothetical protein
LNVLQNLSLCPFALLMALLTLITRLSDGFPLVRLTWRAAGAQRTARL